MQIMERKRAGAELATAFSEHLARFVEDSTRRQLAAPEMAGCDREVETAIREATATGADMLALALRSPASASSVAEARSAPLARAAAQHDVPLTMVLRSYRISHAVAVDHVLQYAERGGVPMEIVCEAIRSIFRHMDSIVAVGSRTYVDERRRINSRPERARYLRIKAVLDGAGDLGLPYPLDAHHVAIVLRGSQPAATLAAVAEAAGGAPLLVTEPPDGKVWAWVACGPMPVARSLPGSADTSRVSRGFGPPTARPSWPSGWVRPRAARSRRSPRSRSRHWLSAARN
jgi:hypothetical protein